MNIISKIYKEAINDAKEQDALAKTKCLKKKLEDCIGNDMEKLMLYKSESMKVADLGTAGFAIAAISVAVSWLAPLVTERDVWMQIFLGIYMLLILIYATIMINRSEKCKKVLVILEYIEKNMDSK